MKNIDVDAFPVHLNATLNSAARRKLSVVQPAFRKFTDSRRAREGQ